MDSLKRLDRAVGRLIDALEKERERSRQAKGRVAELEKLLKRFEKNGVDPTALSGKVKRLQKENRELKSRIKRGREGAERVLAKIKFLEEKR